MATEYLKCSIASEELGLDEGLRALYVRARWRWHCGRRWLAGGGTVEGDGGGAMGQDGYRGVVFTISSLRYCLSGTLERRVKNGTVGVGSRSLAALLEEVRGGTFGTLELGSRLAVAAL